MKKQFRDNQTDEQFALETRTIHFDHGETLTCEQFAYTWARFDWLVENTTLSVDQILELAQRNQLLGKTSLRDSLEAVIHYAFKVWSK